MFYILFKSKIEIQITDKIEFNYIILNTLTSWISNLNYFVIDS